MSDQEIIEKAVNAIKESQVRAARENAEYEAYQIRLESIIEVVVRTTKCERRVALDVVKGILGPWHPLPQTTNGERLG
jgi:hypothetical protein